MLKKLVEKSHTQSSQVKCPLGNFRIFHKELGLSSWSIRIYSFFMVLLYLILEWCCGRLLANTAVWQVYSCTCTGIINFMGHPLEWKMKEKNPNYKMTTKKKLYTAKQRKVENPTEKIQCKLWRKTLLDISSYQQTTSKSSDKLHYLIRA